MQNIFHLPNRSLLAVSGADAAHLLHAISTQNITTLTEGTLLYALHLSPQGKLLFDFFVFKHNNMYFIDCHHSQLMPLAKALYSYKLNMQVEFDDLSTESTVFWTNEAPVLSNNTLTFADPRLPQAGYRSYHLATGQTSTHTEEPPAYRHMRLTFGIPDIAYDFPPETKLFPADLQLDKLHAINFQKGCYVGQEVTARLKHRSRENKMLCTATLQLNTPAAALKQRPVKQNNKIIGLCLQAESTPLNANVLKVLLHLTRAQNLVNLDIDTHPLQQVQQVAWQL